MLIYFVIITGILLVETVVKAHMRKNKSKIQNKMQNKTHNKIHNKMHNMIRIEVMENEGMAGGRLSEKKTFVRIANGLVAAMSAIYLLILHRKKGVTFETIGLAAAIGGGLSNYLDRIRKGSVTDYLTFPHMPFKKLRKYVYNIADLCIFFGITIYGGTEVMNELKSRLILLIKK